MHTMHGSICVRVLCCALSEIWHFKATTTLNNSYSTGNFRRMQMSVQIILVVPASFGVVLGTSDVDWI